MEKGTAAADLLDALGAAVVEADPRDGSGVAAVARALAAAARGGALPGRLAAEATELGGALDGEHAGAALARIEALLGDDAPPPPIAPGGAVTRDAETVELTGDFLSEANEGLARADAILLTTEREGADPERTNALFRVFHTIKGVAGFLDLAEIVALSHATEHLLDRVREGTLALEGEVFDAVFEATALLRQLLERLRAAVDAGEALEPHPAVAGLVIRIQAAGVAGGAPGHGTMAPTATPPPDAQVPPERAPQPSAPPAAEPESADRGGGDAPAESRRGGGDAHAEAPRGGRLRQTVKVDLERVDSVVQMIGELIIVEAMVAHAPELQRVASLELRNHLNQLTKISRDLQDVTMRMRMVPVRGVFQKMARLVRELSRKTGKDVVLELHGEDTEMDRSMVERLEDPLVHLVRNAIDHGMELPEERRAAGKPPRCTLRLAARHEGGSIVVELADDGRGLARERILARAREKGLLREGEAPGDSEVLGLIFLPGFSTAAKVTEISGRGVGMDVVKRNVEGMRGRVSVSSTPGRGTTFRLVLPLTLAVIDGMLVSCGAERYIVPSLSIVESLRPTAGMISRVAGRGEIVNVRGEILPLLRLRRLLDLPGEEPPPTAARVVVAEGLGRKVGLVVDDVLTRQQVVIKPLGNGLEHLDFLSGAAILSDGRVGLILNVDRLASLASRPDASRRSAATGA